MSSEKIVLNFFISRGAKQIRIVLNRDGATWSQIKSELGAILNMEVDHLHFSNSVNGQSIDAEDDNSTSFVTKLATKYHHISIHNEKFLREKQEALTLRKGVPVFVQTLDNKMFCFFVDLETTTVHDIKLMIDLMNGIVPFQQRLIYQGKQLEDSAILSTCNIIAHCTITLVYRVLDGIVPDVSEQDTVFSDLPSLVIYDMEENEVVFKNKPYLFRSEIALAS